MTLLQRLIMALYTRFIPVSRRYILVGITPLQFQWLDKPPYEIIRAMAFDPDNKWAEVEGKIRLYGTIVDTKTGIVTELRHANNGYFAWSFSEYRGDDKHPHPTEGSWWVEAHPCFEAGGACG